MLPLRRRIAGFFARLLLIYGLFVIPWPGVKAAYAAFFSRGANIALQSSVPGGRVRFRPVPPPAGKYDTYIHFFNKQSGARKSLRTSSRDPAYLQTACLRCASSFRRRSAPALVNG